MRRLFNLKVLEETVQWATSKLSPATLRAAPKNRQLLLLLLKTFQALFKQTILAVTAAGERPDSSDVKLCQGTLFNLLDFLMELF
jgi:hypothetical protein